MYLSCCVFHFLLGLTLVFSSLLCMAVSFGSDSCVLQSSLISYAKFATFYHSKFRNVFHHTVVIRASKHSASSSSIYTCEVPTLMQSLIDQTYQATIIKVALNILEYIFVNSGSMNNKTRKENTEHGKKLIPKETFQNRRFQKQRGTESDINCVWVLSWEQ